MPILVGIGALALVAQGVLQVTAPAAPDAVAREAAVKAATDAVQTVVNLEPETADERLDELFERSVPSLRETFGTDSSALTDALADKKVFLTGFVQQVGIASLDSSTGEVIVDASGVIARNDSAQQSERSYRFRVALRQEQGEWQVSRIRLDG